MIPTPRAHTITLRRGDKCHSCGGHIRAGLPVQYHPPITAGVRGYITHRPGDTCASKYTIHFVYTATRKQVSFDTYSAAEAIQKARAWMQYRLRGVDRWTDGRRDPRVPLSLMVYQGSVRVCEEVF